MRTSPTLAAIAPALVAALGALTDPPMGGQGQARAAKYPYARLADILPVVRTALAAHGLVVVQATDGAGVLTTTLLHRSGEWIAGDYPLVLDPDPQRQGSAVTYARRYGLLALLSLVGAEDDDGASAKPRKETPAAKADRQAGHDPSWTADARAKFCAAVAAEGVDYDRLAAWLEAHGNPRPSSMTTQDRRAVYADVRRGGPARERLDEWERP